MQRRTLITGLSALILSPAIVRAESLMPISRQNHFYMDLIESKIISEEPYNSGGYLFLRKRFVTRRQRLLTSENTWHDDFEKSRASAIEFMPIKGVTRENIFKDLMQWKTL